jgi:hypothetical protein
MSVVVWLVRGAARFDRSWSYTARSLSLLLLAAWCSGCTRASAAAFLPSLQLGVTTRRIAQAAAGGQGGRSEPWDAVFLVSALFRSRTVAAELALRAELAPETWIAPCDADDFICLQEAADAEHELRDVLGELQ